MLSQRNELCFLTSSLPRCLIEQKDIAISVVIPLFLKVTGKWTMRKVRGKSITSSKKAGGGRDASNCLAACIKCNRLRCHRTGQEVRNLLMYGLIARDEIKKKTHIGKAIDELKEKRFWLTRTDGEGLENEATGWWSFIRGDFFVLPLKRKKM